MNKSLLLAFFMIVSAHFAFGQQDIVYDNMIYMPNIKSVTFNHQSLEMSMPIIDFNTSFQGSLSLSFDDLDGGFKEYTYEIRHCDKDWYPSELDEIEFLDGFNGEDIEDFAFSANAYSDYTNYMLSLPNDDVNWLISGNYLLIIRDSELDVPVITRRFMVAENNVKIGFQIMKPRNVRKLNTHQEIKLTINFDDFRISRPIDELYVTVVQNGNWNGALNNIKGNFTVGQTLQFNQYDEVIFPALKEFRNFDIRTLEYATEFVNSIDRDNYETTVLLDLAQKRFNRNFINEVDANGYFLLDNQDARDGTITSEYCKVIFNLESEKKYDGDVYMIGSFSDWQAKDEYRLEYDPTRGLYLGQAMFKQGYYDYMYALQQPDGLLDIDFIEGSFYETENDYHVLVYYRPFGALFDRLIGVTSFNSNPNN